MQVGDHLGDKASQVFALAMAKKLQTNDWADREKTESAQKRIFSLSSMDEKNSFLKLSVGG